MMPGARVRIADTFDPDTDSPTLAARLRALRDTRAVGVIARRESMGELTAYAVDFGDAELLADHWWYAKELEPEP